MSKKSVKPKSLIPRPSSVPCHNFIDNNGNTRQVTAIIVPIKITLEGKAIRISWACNNAKHCQSKTCIYTPKQAEAIIP